jgi:hypothetical protein
MVFRVLRLLSAIGAVVVVTGISAPSSVTACNEGCRYEWDVCCYNDCGIWYEYVDNTESPECQMWPHSCYYYRCAPIENPSGQSDCSTWFVCSGCNYDDVRCCNDLGCVG